MNNADIIHPSKSVKVNDFLFIPNIISISDKVKSCLDDAKEPPTNFNDLYEVIIRSQKVLNEFPEYKALIKENRYDFDEKLKIQFIPYKLFDIYNYNNNLVYEWANTNYIDKFEYNSDYYKGDMKSELDTMYLRDYLNRNKINNKKI